MISEADMIILLISAPLLAYVIAKAAGMGWFGEKFKHHRRLVDGISKGDRNGQSSGK